ncbi:hypothetical protein PIB30_004002 [Stylosanthes scabra]|uniref:Helicase C-terminal domain-containing protein n=1 Tax=Stylosanthes scabra TaxID=79078 RepID=A0ABU6W3K1_9FABA|nr:hypothetical protein [Stylosanthes scabra]
MRRFLLASAAAVSTAATAASTYTFLQQGTSTDGELKGRAAFLSNFPSSFNFGGGKDESRGNTKDLYYKARILRMLVSLFLFSVCIESSRREKILFTRTQHDADQLTHFLKRTAECEALHGRDTSQSQTPLARFRDGDLKILVASDDFASDDYDGLSNPNVYSLIAIHFDVPNSSEAFVRRSGITGRVPNIVVHQTDDSLLLRLLSVTWEATMYFHI